jgi:hypothetical protein
VSNQTHILKKDQVKLGSDLRLHSIAIIILPLLLVTISISGIDHANKVATFLCLCSILKLCVTEMEISIDLRIESGMYILLTHNTSHLDISNIQF